MAFVAVLVFAINFAISWHNARVVGLDWVESKQIGGWMRFVVWMAWLMSAVGFTQCYVEILAWLAHSGGYIDAKAMDATLSLGFVVLIPGFIIAGTVLWIDSLVVAWRQRDLPSIATAAWNTFAEIHNVHSAVSGVGGAFKSIGSFSFDEDEAKGAVIIVVVLIVVTAIAGGFITTELIRRHYAGSRPLPQRAAAAAA